MGEVENDIQGKNGLEVVLESEEDVEVESDTEMDGTMALTTEGLSITVLLMIWGKSGNEEIGSEMAEISAAVVSTGTVKMSSIASGGNSTPMGRSVRRLRGFVQLRPLHV